MHYWLTGKIRARLKVKLVPEERGRRPSLGFDGGGGRGWVEAKGRARAEATRSNIDIIHFRIVSLKSIAYA